MKTQLCRFFITLYTFFLINVCFGVQLIDITNTDNSLILLRVKDMDGQNQSILYSFPKFIPSTITNVVTRTNITNEIIYIYKTNVVNNTNIITYIATNYIYKTNYLTSTNFTVITNILYVTNVISLTNTVNYTNYIQITNDISVTNDVPVVTNTVPDTTNNPIVKNVVYVYSGATGSRTNGLDWKNALKSIPSSFKRGYTYLIAKGSYGGVSASTAVSGTNYVYIIKATESNHGTNYGWSSDMAEQVIFTAFYITTPYWYIDGAYRNDDWRSGYGFKINNTGNKEAIHLGSGSLSASWGGQDSSAGNIVIKNVEINGTGLDSSIHDVAIKGVWGINNLLVSKCYFHDFGNCVFITDHNSGWTLEYSVFARNSSDSVYHAEGLAGQGDSNLTIRYCIWEDIEGTGFIVNLGRDSSVYKADNWQIYGNVFMYTINNPYKRTGVGDGAIVCLSDASNKEYATNWKIYNNTFYNIPGYCSGVEFGASPASGVPNNSNIQVYNNFWYSNDAPANQTLGSCTSCISDYNRFDKTSYTGTQANSEVNSSADSSIFVDLSAKNFRLTRATKAGITLSSPYDEDMDGKKRNFNGWDIGAFDY